MDWFTRLAGNSIGIEDVFRFTWEKTPDGDLFPISLYDALARVNIEKAPILDRINHLRRRFLGQRGASLAPAESPVIDDYRFRVRIPGAVHHDFADEGVVVYAFLETVEFKGRAESSVVNVAGFEKTL